MDETLRGIVALSAVDETSGCTGEESARAVANMRAAVGDRELLARYTQATLRENGLSYRDQEFHTGLAASTVYNMALGKETGLRAVQQFAAFAAHKGCRCETRAFWKELLERLQLVDASPARPERTSVATVATERNSTPEDVALIYARLRQPGSRKAVLDLLNALAASEAGRPAPDMRTAA